jgi:hypothetical protein
MCKGRYFSIFTRGASGGGFVREWIPSEIGFVGSVRKSGAVTHHQTAAAWNEMQPDPPPNGGGVE